MTFVIPSHTLANALETARDKFRADACMMASHALPRLADQYAQQAAELEPLIDALREFDTPNTMLSETEASAS